MEKIISNMLILNKLNQKYYILKTIFQGQFILNKINQLY